VCFALLWFAFAFACLLWTFFSFWICEDRVEGEEDTSVDVYFQVPKSRLYGMPLLLIIMVFTILISCSQRDGALVSGFRT
jgi:hypothetical protein